MDLTRSFVIEGKVVAQTSMVLQGLNIYQHEGEDSTTTLFFVNKDNEVVYQMEIEADCGQNVGYISSIEGKKI